MAANWIIGAIIFAYSAWAIYSYARKAKQGKCAVCSLNKSCDSPCSAPPKADN